MINKIFVRYKFKNILKPSDSALHYLFEEEKKTDPNSTSTPPKPTKFGATGNRFNIKKTITNPIMNRVIKTKFSKRSRSITVVAKSQKTEQPKPEKFMEVTEILGDETKLNTTISEEKCEKPKQKPVIAEEIELAVISESEDIKGEMKNFTTKMEILTGFRSNKEGTAIVTQPVWSAYNGELLNDTTIFKQVPVGDITDNIDYPYPHKYKLINNNEAYKRINIGLQAPSRSLEEASQLYTVVDPMFTQGNIVINQTDSATVSDATPTSATPAVAAPAVPSITPAPTQTNMGGY